MINNNQLIKEIKQWQSENIITEDQADILITRYSDNSKKNPTQIAVGIVGTLLVCAGIIVTIASLWEYIPQSVRSVLAFMPLTLSFIAAILVIIKKFDNDTIREISALVYCMSVIGTLRLTEWLYSTPTDYARFILCCGIMIFPVMLIFKSQFACTVFLFTILNWGMLVSEKYNGQLNSYIIFSVVSVIALSVLYYFYKSNKTKNKFYTLLFTWITAAALFTLTIIFTNISDADIGVILFIDFSILSAVGSSSSLNLVPLSSAGTAGTFILLLLYATGSVESITDSPGMINTIYPVFLSIVMIILLVVNKNKDYKKIISVVTSVIITILSIITAYTSNDNKLPVYALTLITVLLLVSGIIYLTDGIKSYKISSINLGIISVAAVLFTLLENNMNSLFKGIFIIILGLLFTMLNIVMIKQQRKAKLRQEAQQNET